MRSKKKIGNTTFIVNSFFPQTGNQTIASKLENLIKADVQMCIRDSYTTIRKTLKPIMMKSKYAAARPAVTRKVLFKFATDRW